VQKATNKQIKDSSAVALDQSKQFVKSDSTANTSTKEIETTDLVVVLKDTATGYFSLKGDSIHIPAQAIKEIRYKRNKRKDKQESTSITKDVAILNDKKQSVTVSEKKVTKTVEKRKVSWFWIIVIIAGLVLYISRKRIYEILKKFIVG
jgi:hypothetical protein